MNNDHLNAWGALLLRVSLGVIFVAHSLYLQARDWFLQPDTSDSLVQAQRLFELATETSPAVADKRKKQGATD